MLQNINLNSHFLSQDIPQLFCACFEEANEKLWNRIIRYVIKRPLRKFNCNLIKRININFYMLISMLRRTLRNSRHIQTKRMNTIYLGISYVTEQFHYKRGYNAVSYRNDAKVLVVQGHELLVTKSFRQNYGSRRIGY